MQRSEQVVMRFESPLISALRSLYRTKVNSIRGAQELSPMGPKVIGYRVINVYFVAMKRKQVFAERVFHTMENRQ